MHQALQTTLEDLILSKDASLVFTTVMVYDYLLTLPNEIEYIWCKRWTWVSMLFVVVRYAGFCWVIPSALVDCALIYARVDMCVQIYYGVPISNGRIDVSISTCMRTAIILMGSYAFSVFLCAADVVMIMRVYAMWNRSKLILWILLSIFVPQSISHLVLLVVYLNPNTHISVVPVQILGFSHCDFSFVNTPQMLDDFLSVPRSILSALLLFLAVLQSLRQSIEMYRITKQWQPNRYMQLFVKDGIIYFVANLAGVVQGHPVLNSYASYVTSLIFYITIGPTMPRFIISVRKLYEHECRRRWEEADNDFGASIRCAADGGAIVSTVEFIANSDPSQECDYSNRAVESETDEPGAIRLQVLGGDCVGRA